MIIAIISVLFSFLLDNFLSTNISYSLTSPSIFSTMYTLIALFIIYPYFNNEKKYLYILVSSALFFDMVYTSTFLFNLIIFLGLYFIVKKLNFWLPNNLLMSNITSIIVIFLYHIISFIVLSLVKYNGYDISLLIKILTHSILATIIYTSILYFVLKKIYDKFHIKQIR